MDLPSAVAVVTVRLFPRARAVTGAEIAPYDAEHESDILLHKAAKKSFDEWNLKKLPTVKSLNAEYTDLVKQKKALYAEYSSVRSEMRELLIHKSNVEKILGIDETEAKKQTEQERN